MPEPEQHIPQSNPFDIKIRQRMHSEQMVDYVGELLVPVTDGFEQINLDMSFANLGFHDLFDIRMQSTTIDLCRIYGLKTSKYLAWGKMATVLVSSRSISGKSMDMFTTITTKQEQQFTDNTRPEKQGWFMFGKKKQQ